MLSGEKYPRFEVKFGGDDAEREPLVIDAEEFIGVKSIHAKGKRVSNYKVDTVTELEPRIVEEEPEEEDTPDGSSDDPAPAPPAGDAPIINDSDISQQQVRDKLTGQTRLLFDDEE